MRAKCTAQKDISKHTAHFPALQSWWLTLPSSSASQHHWLRTLDTNLWLCSHKHGPNFLQLFGFPLCFLLEVGVLLLDVQAFLLWTTFSTDTHTLTITGTLCNSKNKRKNYLNKAFAKSTEPWLSQAGSNLQGLHSQWETCAGVASAVLPEQSHTWVTYPGVCCLCCLQTDTADNPTSFSSSSLRSCSALFLRSSSSMFDSSRSFSCSSAFASKSTPPTITFFSNADSFSNRDWCSCLDRQVGVRLPVLLCSTGIRSSLVS